MNAAAADLRLVYGHGAAKKIARRFGIAVVTAKSWLAGHSPSAREQEIARALIADCLELERAIADTRRRWAEVADATGGAVAGGTVDCGGAAAGRVGR